MIKLAHRQTADSSSSIYSSKLTSCRFSHFLFHAAKWDGGKETHQTSPTHHSLHGKTRPFLSCSRSLPDTRKNKTSPQLALSLFSCVIVERGRALATMILFYFYLAFPDLCVLRCALVCSLELHYILALFHCTVSSVHLLALGHHHLMSKPIPLPREKVILRVRNKTARRNVDGGLLAQGKIIKPVNCFRSNVYLWCYPEFNFLPQTLLPGLKWWLWLVLHWVLVSFLSRFATGSSEGNSALVDFTYEELNYLDVYVYACLHEGSLVANNWVSK